MSKEINSTTQSKFRHVSWNEVFDQMKAQIERWHNEKRVGSVSFDAEFDAITFHHDEQTKNFRYYIYLSRINTPEKQMQWLNHLRHKRWFTREVFNDFMSVLENLKLLDKGLDS